MLLENTAGTQGPLGRNFDELAELVDLLDGDRRVGICLDSCHLLASGFEIRTAEALGTVVDEFDAKVGLDRLRCLHLNDSKTPLGGNRDRHANLGEGEIGDAGLGVFLSEPRFDELPTLIETGGEDGAPGRADVELARKLRKRGIAARDEAGGDRSADALDVFSSPALGELVAGVARNGTLQSETETGDRERDRRHGDHVEAGERERANVPSDPCRPGRPRRGCPSSGCWTACCRCRLC